MIISGVIHIHSKYSFDGVKSVHDIKEFYKQRGHKFVIITDHNEKMSKDDFDRFLSECRALSDDDFIIIPGLEVRCLGDFEIITLNITEKMDISEPAPLIKRVQGAGGLAVLAHPCKSWHYLYFNFKDIFKDLNGIEIWNYRYDGGYAPRLTSLDLLKKIREASEDVFAYAGADLHQRFNSVELAHYVDVDRLGLREVIRALRIGNFFVGTKHIKLNSSAEIERWQHRKFGFINSVHDFTKTYKGLIRKISPGRGKTNDV